MTARRPRECCLRSQSEGQEPEQWPASELTPCVFHGHSFGLSAALGPDMSHVSAFVNGTPFYSAPEIALTGRVTQASDAYSYGVIMVELYK